MDLNHVKCMPRVWNNPHITINTMWMIQFGIWTPNKVTWPIWRCHVACSHWSKTTKSTCHLCTQSTILCHMSDHYFSTSILRSFPRHSTWNSLDGATLHAMVVPHGMPWWFHVALFYWSIWQSKNAKKSDTCNTLRLLHHFTYIMLTSEVSNVDVIIWLRLLPGLT